MTKPKSKETVDSLESIGIGQHEMQMYATYRLLPEGRRQYDSSVYDCVVFIIYCPEHDQILMNHNEHSKITWLPFVVMSEGDTWIEASQKGVEALIGRRDPESEAEAARKAAPAYSMSYLHIMRIQSTTQRFSTRITQFIRLEDKKNVDFRCCQKQGHLTWLRAFDLLHKQWDNFWGPEVKVMIERMVAKKSAVIEEYPLEKSFKFLLYKQSDEKTLLLHHKIRIEHILEFYESYLNHTYPSVYMCFRSFKSYLVKHGFDKKDSRLRHIFNAFQGKSADFIDFHEFLVGLVCLEPNCSEKAERRIQFVFAYYDIGRKGVLDKEEFLALIQDLHAEANEEELKAKAKKAAIEIGLVKNHHLPYENFQSAIRKGIIDSSHLCRAKKSILEQISNLMKMKSSQAKLPAAERKSIDATTAGRTKENLCIKCNEQNYNYSQHCVTINTKGRCVQPIDLTNEWQTKEAAEEDSPSVRYSKEFVFNSSSIPNILLDTIRYAFEQKLLVKRGEGIFIGERDRQALLPYVRDLCETLSALLAKEKKLIKINGPAFVVGDLRGNIASLLEIEARCFSTFPVLVENLVFLGNYHGEFPFGFECLLFVFALKVLQPNKVFLLRGMHESLPTATSLAADCRKRYGTADGDAVYDSLIDIFNQLPFAVVIDEAIACVHSGIPKNCRLEKLIELHKSVPSIHQEAFAFEIVSTYPAVSISDQKQKHHPKNSAKVLGDPFYHRDIFSKSPSTSDRINKNESKIVEVEKNDNDLGLEKTGSKSNQQLTGKRSSTTVAPRRSLLASLSKTTRRKSQIRSCTPQKTKSSGGLLPRSASSNLLLEVEVGKENRLSSNGNVCNERKPSSTCAVVRNSSAGTTGLRLSTKSAVGAAGKKYRMGHDVLKAGDSFDQRDFYIFLRRHHYRFMIRSQSVCRHGFKMNFRGKCLTVFSCSGYVRKSDRMGLIHVDRFNDEIRLIGID